VNETLQRIIKYRTIIGMPTPAYPTFSAEKVGQYSNFMVEELNTELMSDPKSGLTPEDHLVHVADCLADGLVFLEHLVCECGMHTIFEEICDEVRVSNNTKGDNGVYFDENNKLIKGPGYRPPNLRQFFGGEIDLQLKAVSLEKNAIPEFVQFIARSLLFQKDKGDESVHDVKWVPNTDGPMNDGVFTISGGTGMFVWLKKMLLGDWLVKRRISKKSISELGTVLVTVNNKPYTIQRVYSM
jgi:hypothetical protein